MWASRHLCASCALELPVSFLLPPGKFLVLILEITCFKVDAINKSDVDSVIQRGMSRRRASNTQLSNGNLGRCAHSQGGCTWLVLGLGFSVPDGQLPLLLMAFSHLFHIGINDIV